MARLFAVFLAEDGLTVVANNLEGDWNDQNLADAFKVTFPNVLESWSIPIHECGFPSDSVFVCELPSDWNRQSAKMVAAGLGFAHDYAPGYDAAHFVVFV